MMLEFDASPLPAKKMSEMTNPGCSETGAQPRRNGGSFWKTPVVIVAWSAGLALLSAMALGWSLGDGIDLLNHLRSGPPLRASKLIWPLSVAVFGLIWLPGTIAASRIHRSRSITVGIAICGVLAFLAAVLVIFSFVPGGNPR